MKQLMLSALPARTLEEVEDWLWRHVPKDRVVLGGGTVLAARWGHRVSTDVDLFAEQGLLGGVDRDALEHDGSRRTRRFDLPEHFMTLTTPDGGELSLFCDAPPPRQEGEIAAGVAAMPTFDILVGKLRGRMMHNGVLVARDMYDLCLASHFDPSALDRALRVLSESNRQEIARELRTEPRGFRENPIIEPLCPSVDQRLLWMARYLFEEGPERFKSRYGGEIAYEIRRARERLDKGNGQ